MNAGRKGTITVACNGEALLSLEVDVLDEGVTHYINIDRTGRQIRNFTIPVGGGAQQEAAQSRQDPAPTVTVERRDYCHTARFTYDNNHEGDAQWRDYYDLAAWQANDRPVPQWLVRHLLGLPLVLR